MNSWILTVLCILIAAAIVIWNDRKTKRTVNRLERMLDAAMKGEPLEETFNESRMSALETRFAHYLSSSAISAKNVAAEKDKIKTLIADISHQTKTPITNLLLHSELLAEGALPEDLRDNAEAIHTQTEKLQFLIDSLIKLSRLENGILTLSPRLSPLQPTLQKVQEQLAAKAAEKGLSFTLQNTDISAAFDPKWTAEALCNIADNAVKYTRQGGIAISAAAYELFVRIDITDTGIGISETEQAEIFSRFYRSQTVRDSEGVGIGLYLAREIISGEGGYIKVTSRVGQGSTFSVFLPRT